MTDAPFARHLVRFSRQAPAGASVAPLPPPAAEPEPTVTMSVAALDARLASARDELRTALESGYAAERARVEQAHAEAMAVAVAAAARRRDGEDAAALAAQVEAALEAVRTSLAAEIAAALVPLLGEAAAARAVASLVETVERVLADPEHPVLTISGPPARLAAIREALGARDGISFAAGGEGEVRVSANGILIETRIAPALAALAMGDA